MQSQINPDFHIITELCKNELNIKFAEYGNSWMQGQCKTQGYWLKRIANELEEYEKSMTETSAMRKLLNIINMAAMAYDNHREGRIVTEFGI